MINPADLLKIKKAKDVFVVNHPKFPAFLSAVKKNSLEVDAVIEIKVTTKEGKELSSNLKVKESDLELLNIITTMAHSK